MPFVTFENSTGFGVVVPDALGGTELLYLGEKLAEDFVLRLQCPENHLKVDEPLLPPPRDNASRS